MSFFSPHRSALLSAINAGRIDVARSLARWPEETAKLPRATPCAKTLTTFARASHHNQVWLMALPLNWGITDTHGNTLMHAVFAHLEEKVESLGGFGANRHDLTLEETVLEPVLRLLAPHLSPDVFDQENHAGFIPARLYSCRKGRGLISMDWCRSVMEDERLRHTLAPTPSSVNVAAHPHP
jgi:hypothetical protein